MSGKGSTGKFIEYFSKPLNQEQLTYLNSLNKVGTERRELYRDFAISLFHLINDTYMGDDVTVTTHDINKHFTWCWRKNLTNFEEEHIFFKDKGDHFLWFEDYITDIFYTRQEKQRISPIKVACFWDHLFSSGNSKTKSEYDLFIEVYKVLDKYLVRPA